MSRERAISPEQIEQLHERLKSQAAAGGYHLNPDSAAVRGLLRGLLVNESRFGYQACPCRLAIGVQDEDLDIICPCDYRDPDLDEYGVCYCGLYVSEAVVRGQARATSVPERRLSADQRQAAAQASPQSSSVPEGTAALPFPVWRCQVCGYLCARSGPPEVCPICKVKRERFARFI